MIKHVHNMIRGKRDLLNGHSRSFKVDVKGTVG